MFALTYGCSLSLSLSGFLSTMNVWVDKNKDIRFSLNDLYMVLLMTGWMFFFTGIYYRETYALLFGLVLVASNIWCIKTQFMINQHQYILGMIPHHSMAIYMSKRLLERENNIIEFLNNIIMVQEQEIAFLKNTSLLKI